MNNFLNSILAYVILVGAVFGFLTICNWDYNPSEWNGFSRFILAFFGIVGVRVFFDD